MHSVGRATVVLLLLACAETARAAAYFDAPFLLFPTGGDPRSVVIKDLDHDGRPDLVFVDLDPGSHLSILPGQGDGTFLPRITVATGQDAGSVSVEDLDGDGGYDAIVSGFFDQKLWVHAGTGLAFSPPVGYSLGFNPGPIEMADLDADGYRDAIISHPVSPVGISVRWGQAARAFGAQLDLPGQSYTAAVAFADFDGDGRLDLLSTNTGSPVNRDSTLTLYRNLGARAFAAPAVFAAGLGPMALGLGRFDADTNADVAVACADDSTVRILVSDGAGHLTRTPQRLRFEQPPRDVAAGDIDGDGKTDLVVTTENYGVYLCRGHGDGSFATPRWLDGPGMPGAVAIGDLDGNGIADVVVAGNWANGDSPAGVAVYIGQGAGRLGSGIDVPVAPSGEGLVTLSDLDGDTRLDAISMLHEDASLVFLAGHGDGTFSDPVFEEPTETTTNGGFALAPLDAGPIPDVVRTRGFSTGYLDFLSGAGDGTFSTAWTIPIGRAPGIPLLSDFNQDGSTDVLVPLLFVSDSIAIVFMNGLGNVDSVRYRSFMPPHGSITAIGQIDSDALPDLVVAGQNEAVVHWGSPGGRFTTSQHIGLSETPYALTIADLDQDGLPEIVAACEKAHVYVAERNGARTFAAPVTIQGGYDPSWVVARDVTGDSRPDIVTGNNSIFGVTLCQQRPVGSFFPPVLYGAGPYPRQVAIEDLNADGLPDIVAASRYLSGSLTVLLNATGGLASVPSAIDRTAPSHRLSIHPSPVTDRAYAVFDLSWPADVTLELFDSSGRRIRASRLGPQASGSHRVEWRAFGVLEPGVYFARMRASDGETDTRRVVVVR